MKVKMNGGPAPEEGDYVYDHSSNALYRVTEVGAYWSEPGECGYFCELEDAGDPFSISDEEFEAITLSVREE